MTPLAALPPAVFAGPYSTEPTPENHAALSDAALGFVMDLARSTGARNVFEFGSGRSTAAFLAAGLAVFSIEDSSLWLDTTLRAIPVDARRSLRTRVLPLERRWCGGFPVLSWKLPAHVLDELRAADVILVDSPFYVPFREHALRLALAENARAAVILDDTAIPCVARFCDRIATDNPALFHARVAVGHTMDVFQRNGPAPVRLTRSAYDVARGWRRWWVRPGALA